MSFRLPRIQFALFIFFAVFGLGISVSAAADDVSSEELEAALFEDDDVSEVQTPRTFRNPGSGDPESDAPVADFGNEEPLDLPPLKETAPKAASTIAPATTSGTASASAKVAKLPKLPLGQLLIVGFKGTHISEGLSEVIRQSKPGAILLFGRNVKSAKQVAALNHAAQDLSMKVTNSPLLIAIDQEGGNVIRIRHTPLLPSALAISRTRDVGIAKKSGIATGRLLKSLGINVNLAPVVDVADPETDKFLGSRSFGDDAHRVSRMTTAVAHGLQEMGVLPVAKHFPGHGDATGDSHLMAASNASTLQQLEDRDLIPYYSLAKSMKRPWGAMLAHVSFPKIDSTGAPATFSKPIVTGILRQEISKNALVMTDDIEMAGAATEKDVGQRAVRAIEAGADMVMIAWSRNIQREVVKALEQALESGRLKRSRVEEALGRIAAVKKSYIPQKIKLASQEELKRSLQHPDFADLGNAVLRSVVRNQRERRPAEQNGSDKIQPGPDPVLVLSARTDFFNAFRRSAAGYTVKNLHLRPSQRAEVERVLRSNPESPVIVYVSGRQVADFISKIDDELAARMILVNIETRASLKNPERFRDVLDVHFRHPDLGAVVAEVYLESEKSTAAPRLPANGTPKRRRPPQTSALLREEQ